VQQDLCYLAARFNEKGCLQVSGGDSLTWLAGLEAPESLF